MRTFYCTFGLASPIKNVLLQVQSESRNKVVEVMVRKLGGSFCEVYQWDNKTAAEKAERNGYTIVDGGVIE